jgi:hypothetical protein
MFQDRTRAEKHVLVWESEDHIATGFQVGIPVFVMGRLLPGLVNLAVHLDHEVQLAATEVSDVAIDLDLPAKFQAKELPIAEPLPEFLLRQGRLAPHLPSQPITSFFATLHVSIRSL